jgi:RHS repeat-associated protein
VEVSNLGGEKTALYGAMRIGIYPGQYYDSETGLHYNWNRYYDPTSGRYISADPIGLAGGMNLYAYVGGNPVNGVDPEGLTGETLPGPVPLPVPPVAIPGTPENEAFVDATMDLIDSLTDSTDDTCKPKGNCASTYPNLKLCSVLRGKGYIMSSKQEALNYFRMTSGLKNVKCDQERTASEGPCAGQGKHYRVTGGGGHLGSITSCPCCEDTSNVPVKKNVWRVH